MSERIIEQPEARPWYRGVGFYLLAALIVQHSVSSTLSAKAGELPILRHLYEILVFAIPVFAIRALSRRRRVVVGFIVATVVLLGLRHALVTQERLELLFGLWLIFFLFAIAVLTSVVLRDEKVTVDKIFLACSVYLLIGFGWSLIYDLIYLSDPSAFAFPVEVGDQFPGHLYHFSLTTMTTLGYGDIVPRSMGAKAFANLEAITGQLYVGILIARLVALQITHASDEKK